MSEPVHERHFLQSEAWARFQRALGREIVTDEGDGWSYLASVEPGRFGRIYAPYGPSVDRADALPAALESLTAAARRAGSVFVRFEPIGADVDPTQYGARRVRRVQPEMTWRLDLAPDFDDLLMAMHKSVRQRYRTYERRGVSLSRSEDPADVDILNSFNTETGARNHINMHEAEYLRTQAATLMPGGDAALYIAHFEGEPIAAALVFDDEDRRYYAHGGSSFAHRNLNPGTPLQLLMIQDAKARGAKEYDFYGVSPVDEPDHPWAGFSEFKRSFGGYDHYFHGAWELPVKKLEYTIYDGLRRANS